MRSPTGSACSWLPLALAMGALGVGCGGASLSTLPTLHRHADGCGTGTGAAQDGHVEVYLSLWSGEGEQPFCPGDHLHPQNALQVSIEVVKEAHIYLLYVDPRGESGTLERQDAGEVTRRGVYRIPAGLLTRHAGEAQLFLMVSLKPLRDADPIMYELWQTIHESGSFVDRSGHQHPARHPGARGKPLHFDSSTDLHANFDDHGVAMLALSLHAGD